MIEVILYKQRNLDMPMLILGLGEIEDSDPSWQYFQLYTWEELYDFKTTDDAITDDVRSLAPKRKKYQADSIAFASLSQILPIKSKKEAHNIEITEEERDLLIKELDEDGWAYYEISS